MGIIREGDGGVCCVYCVCVVLCMFVCTYLACLPCLATPGGYLSLPRHLPTYLQPAQLRVHPASLASPMQGQNHDSTSNQDGHCYQMALGVLLYLLRQRTFLGPFVGCDC